MLLFCHPLYEVLRTRNTVTMCNIAIRNVAAQKEEISPLYSFNYIFVFFKNIYFFIFSQNVTSCNGYAFSVMFSINLRTSTGMKKTFH